MSSCTEFLTFKPMGNLLHLDQFLAFMYSADTRVKSSAMGSAKGSSCEVIAFAREY